MIYRQTDRETPIHTHTHARANVQSIVLPGPLVDENQSQSNRPKRCDLNCVRRKITHCSIFSILCSLCSYKSNCNGIWQAVSWYLWLLIAYTISYLTMWKYSNTHLTRMWAIAQRGGRPAEYRWRPVLNAAKFGSRQLLKCRAVTLPKYDSARLEECKVNFAPGKIL